MARARQIKPGFFVNEDIVELPFHTRLLFIGLWTIADRRGILEDRPKKIKMSLFPADNIDIDQSLNELAEYNFINRYEVGGDRFIYITEFEKHQNCHRDEKPSDFPLPSWLSGTDPVQEQPGSGTENAAKPCQHDTGTVPASCQHDTGTVPASCQHDTGTASIFNPITSIFNTTSLSARENFPEVLDDAMQWVAFFVNVHGFQFHEAQTAKTMPMFNDWVARGIRVDDVDMAVMAGNNWLKSQGQQGPPNNPCLYGKFLETVLASKDKHNANRKPKIENPKVDSGFAKKYAALGQTGA